MTSLLRQPLKTLNFELRGTGYEITFPNNRQYVAIQNLKVQLLPNYDAMKFMGGDSQWAQLLADTEAHLSVLAPKLIKDLTVPFGELSLMESKVIVEAYVKQFVPWFQECQDFIFGVNKEPSKSE